MTNHLSKISGIYCIEEKSSNKKYVGSSLDISKRFRDHKGKLNKNKHENSYLQNSWNKVGESFFIFYLLEECSSDILDEKECFWIDKLNTVDRLYGYNLTYGGNRNKKVSKETCEKISQSLTGKPHSLNAIEHMRKSAIGRKHSAMTKEEMSKSRMGNKNSFFGKKKDNSSSKYFGVSYRKNRDRWVVAMSVNSKVKTLGYFKTELSAAQFYNNFVISNNLQNPLNIIKEIKYE